MKPLVLKGSKKEIAEELSQISGEVREAIVFVDEPQSAAHATPTSEVQDIFLEMSPFMVDRAEAHDGREAIYTRVDGE
jgi:hypothetical protein